MEAIFYKFQDQGYTFILVRGPGTVPDPVFQHTVFRSLFLALLVPSIVTLVIAHVLYHKAST
jgi:hypothetical protein